MLASDHLSCSGSTCCPDPRPRVSSRTCQCHRFLLIWWSIHHPNNQPAAVCLACMKSEPHKNQCVKSLYQHIRNPEVYASGCRICDRLKLTNWHVLWWRQWWGMAPCQSFGKQHTKKEMNDRCRGGRMIPLNDERLFGFSQVLMAYVSEVTWNRLAQHSHPLGTCE